MRRGRKVPRRTLIGRIAVGGPPCHVGWVTQLAAGYAFVNVTSSLQHEDLRTAEAGGYMRTWSLHFFSHERRIRCRPSGITDAWHGSVRLRLGISDCQILSLDRSF